MYKNSDNNTAEKLGITLHKTLEKIHSKTSPQDHIILGINTSIELWKEKLKGKWINNVEAILNEIKNKE